MIFAAPLAAVLRGFLLNAPVIPIFAAVLAATSAVGDGYLEVDLVCVPTEKRISSWPLKRLDLLWQR
jgi:hypothetical protein